MAAARQAPRLDALKHLSIWRSFNLKKSGGALLQPAETMVDENINSRDLGLEFDHRCAARRNQGGLHIAHGLSCPFRMDLVEDFADDMEARDIIRSGIAEKDADRFANFGF